MIKPFGLIRFTKVVLVSVENENIPTIFSQFPVKQERITDFTIIEKYFIEVVRTSVEKDNVSTIFGQFPVKLCHLLNQTRSEVTDVIEGTRLASLCFSEIFKRRGLWEMITFLILRILQINQPPICQTTILRAFSRLSDVTESAKCSENCGWQIGDYR